MCAHSIHFRGEVKSCLNVPLIWSSGFVIQSLLGRSIRFTSHCKSIDSGISKDLHVTDVDT